MVPESGSSVNGEVSQILLTFHDENGLDLKNPETSLEIMPPESVSPQQPLSGKLVAGDGDSTLQLQLTVPLSISGVYAIQGKVADQAGNIQVLQEINLPLTLKKTEITLFITPHIITE